MRGVPENKIKKRGTLEMAYHSFTLETALTTFQLEISESTDLFKDSTPVALSETLRTVLEKRVPIATAINTEKAYSELIIVNVLFELLERFDDRISLFSGVDFNVDPENGLNGVCDFLISLSPIQYLLQAPVIVLVEAKKDNPTPGLGQCVAEMVAAQRFNAEKENDIPFVYGVATTGINWTFLKLEGNRLSIDRSVYPIAQCDKILGVLSSMIEQEA